MLVQYLSDEKSNKAVNRIAPVEHIQSKIIRDADLKGLPCPS